MLPRQTAGLGCQAKLLPSALLSKVFLEVSFEPGHMVQAAEPISSIEIGPIGYRLRTKWAY
jgi:hypothetical protein